MATTITPRELATYATRGVAAAAECLSEGRVPESVLTDDCVFHGIPDFCAWHDHIDANDLLAVGFADSWGDDDSKYDQWSADLLTIGDYVQSALDAVFYGAK